MIRKRMLNFNWRLAVAHILVNSLALGLTFLILPGLYIVHPNKLLSLLVSALIFGVLNAFIRPVLQFLMFNFLFATFGLVLVLINFILLFLLGKLLDGWFEATRWWNLLLAAILVGLFGVIFENLLGLTPPIAEHSAQTPVASAQNPIENKVLALLVEDDSNEVSVGQASVVEGGDQKS